MISTQNRIEKHKEHIQKRIYELQSKLKQSRQHMDHHNSKVKPEELPYRRVQAQNQQYIEPAAVIALREREQNKSDSWNHEDQFSQNQKENRGIEKRRQQERSQKKQKLGQGNVGFSQYRATDLQKTHQQSKTTPLKQNSEKSQLYGLMAEILNNQKNLEKQIVMLRSQWTKQQQHSKTLQLKKNYQQVQQKIKPPMKKIDPLKQGKQKVDHKINVYQNAQQNNRQTERTSKSCRMIKRSQEPTFGERERILESFGQADFCESPSAKPIFLPPKPTKKNKVQQQQQILSYIVNNQKRSQRLIVDEYSKVNFWKVLETRIKSTSEGKQRVHCNNRYDNECFVNTFQLQKKIRYEVIAKVYSFVNTCLYK